MSYVDAPPPPAIVMVQEDHGGRFDQYENATERYKIEKRQVRIAGRCASGCTMSLALKTTCVYPQASFGFHTARYRFGDSTNGYDPNAAATYYSQRLFAMYPAKVRAYLGNLTYDMRNVSGAELIELGVPACPSAPVVASNPFSDLVKNFKSRIDQY